MYSFTAGVDHTLCILRERLGSTDAPVTRMSAAEDQVISPSLIKSGTIHTLDIPNGSVHSKRGVAIDFGNSALKIAYALPVDDKVRLHFVSFPRERKDEAFQFIKDNVGDYLESGQEICLTGLGANQFKEELETTLNIRMKSLLETDCFVDGFMFLTEHVSARDLYHRPSDPVLHYNKAVKESAPQTDNLYTTTPGSRVIKSRLSQVEITEEDMFPEVVEYPLLLIMCGSAGLILLVHADGTYEGINDVHPLCGHTLLGIGSMLAGTKSFEELVELAEKGDAAKIDVTSNEVITAADDDGTCSNMTSEADIPILSWGHAVGKEIGDFRQEDRAAAAVTLISYNLAMWSQLSAAQVAVKHVYFCGGIHANSAIIRDEIHKVFAQRASKQRDGIRSNAHFMKLGAYLGSLGCLLANLKAPTE